jgi:hypothetical protein
MITSEHDGGNYETYTPQEYTLLNIVEDLSLQTVAIEIV